MADPTLLYDRYRIVRKLGSGAFATVYLADDLRLGRPVAVKVVSHSADAEGRVQREVHAAAKLSHHHIVKLYEVIEEPEETLLVTEYIQGATLGDLYRRGSLSDRQIAQIGAQVAEALDHAHKRGVVHRDVKPDNIMLVEGDVVDARLMDFGVAQLEDRASVTMDGDLVGTLAYMSPEQGEGRNVDSSSDVYSLALTLYEGFTGRNPFRGKKLQQLLHDVSRPEIPPLSAGRPDLPPALTEVLARAMARDRLARPDAATFARGLAQVVRELPAEQAAPTAATTVRRLAVPSWDQERLAYVGARVVAGGSALCALLYVLPRVPFYPEAAIFPLVAVPAFLALVWPFAGGVLALALLAPPIFAYSAGWGVVYLVPAVLTMGLLRRRRREWAALLPAVVPFAAAAWMGLALLPLTGLIARRWGALIGFWNGLVLAITAGLAGWTTLPYTFTPSPGPVLSGAEHAASPWTVLIHIARFLDARPELSLQTLVFALLSLPLYVLPGSSRQRRMWGATVYLVLALAGLVFLPILALDVPVAFTPFLVAFVPCAIIAYLSALIAPAKGAGSL